MVRLILLAAFIGVIAFAILAAVGTIVAVTRSTTGGDDQMMPAKFQRITYALLVVLMLGVTTGWLGGV
ncbi:MAG: hypothetical protein ACSHW1_02380 [Yoonia sp.]|uniref:hypothetical protein n=1 Tax=Yoonia sp. TaxID=2212373 RepID=UPI003EF1740F